MNDFNVSKRYFTRKTAYNLCPTSFKQNDTDVKNNVKAEEVDGQEENQNSPEIGDLISTIVPQDDTIIEEKSKFVKLAFLSLKCITVCCIFILLFTSLLLIFIERGAISKILPIIEELRSEEYIRFINNSKRQI